MTVALILLKVTVVLAFALLGTRLARHSRASVRHVLLAASFVVLLTLPIASFLVPAISVPVPASVGQALTPLDATLVNEPAPELARATSIPDAAAPRPWSFPSPSTMLIAGWMAGAIVFLVPVMSGLRQVRLLRRSALPWRDGSGVVGGLAVKAGIRRRVQVLLHESLAGPMTCGAWRPAIVLPKDAITWAEEDLRRAIVHELEHVRRGDWISHVASRIVTAVYWFHPIVWVAWRQLALEAERACDDAVLLSATPRAGVPSPASTDYADQLVALAERLSATSSQPHLAMASRSDLATRVGAVLDGRQRRGRAGAVCVAAAVAMCAVLVIAVSPLRLVASVEVTQDAGTSTGRRYDAASIKPCVAEERPTGARGTAGGTNATTSPGRFYVPCVTTEQLIYLAYASYGAPEADRLVNDDFGSASNATKIRGGPEWVHSLKDKYSIEATAAGVTERTILMGYMLRSLLEDRFKLKIHRDTEEVPLLALTVGKGGLKVKPMKDGDCDPDGEPSFDPNTKPKCGNLMMLGGDSRVDWNFGGFPLSALAGQLSRTLRVHVMDRTNVTDKFIFRFQFERGEDAFATEASVFAAVEEQLGLKLEKTRGPRGFIVIDAIERPTPDGPIAPAPSRARGAGDQQP